MAPRRFGAIENVCCPTWDSISYRNSTSGLHNLRAKLKLRMGYGLGEYKTLNIEVLYHTWQLSGNFKNLLTRALGCEA